MSHGSGSDPGPGEAPATSCLGWLGLDSRRTGPVMSSGLSLTPAFCMKQLCQSTVGASRAPSCTGKRSQPSPTQPLYCFSFPQNQGRDHRQPQALQEETGAGFSRSTGVSVAIFSARFSLGRERRLRSCDRSPLITVMFFPESAAPARICSSF
ncbi:hypothetical protein SKAU_G00127300 [Synaphobranchus kaupii]|uniref:Uncharacterized protein n=1 Tax=Synaphobranchus kaupii TaxID=118154 RepID=A0A9Q1FQ40_SYNKA|nr:hypothetical protein SKAU_G00127300 [Synaphobranchus kaupii]